MPKMAEIRDKTLAGMLFLSLGILAFAIKKASL